MGIVIPQYQDRLSPEGLMNIRATAPDMSVNPANTKGMQAFGEAMGTLGATQSHLQRQQANADAMTGAYADLAKIKDETQLAVQAGIDGMKENATLPHPTTGELAPFSDVMKADVQARYAALASKYANATPEVKNFVGRQITEAQSGWNTTINTEQERGTVVTRLKTYEEGVKGAVNDAAAHPENFQRYLDANKVATANLGISSDVRYQKFLESQGKILDAALAKARDNPNTSQEVLDALNARVGNFGPLPSPFRPIGQVAGGLATSTDVEAIIPAIAGAEGATKNPDSSANYKYQFVKGTFIEQARKSYPAETAGKSNAEVLAMRNQTMANGQAIEEKMGPDFIKANAAYLADKNQPVNGTTVYLAHFLGAAGAVKVLTADPNTPIRDLTTKDAQDQNEILREPGVTAQDIINWAGNRMNGQAGRSIPANATGTAGQPGEPSPTQVHRREISPWVQDLVNAVPGNKVEAARFQSVAAVNTQAQNGMALFNQTLQDQQGQIERGVQPQQRFGLADFQQHYPNGMEAQAHYNNYAANLEAGAVVNAIKTMSPQEARAVIDSYKPNDTAPGSQQAALRQNAMIDQYQKVETARHADPQLYAMQNKVGGAQPIGGDWSPQAIAQTLKNRAVVADLMATKFNTDRSTLFTKDEAIKFQKGYEGLPFDKRLEYLEAIRGVIKDPAQFIETIQKITPDHPVAALQAALMTKTTTAPITSNMIAADTRIDPTVVARQIGKGEEYRNPTNEAAKKDGNKQSFSMPDDKLFKQAFENETGTVFRGSSPIIRDTIYQGVLDYYIAKRVDNGLQGKPEVDGDLVAESVRAVTGGIDKSTGHNVIMPWGMDKGEFGNRLKAKYLETMTGAGLGKQVTGNETININPLGDGTYTVTEPTGRPIINPKTNQAMVLDLNNYNAPNRSQLNNAFDQLNQTPPPHVQGAPAPAAPIPGATTASPPKNPKPVRGGL